MQFGNRPNRRPMGGDGLWWLNPQQQQQQPWWKEKDLVGGGMISLQKVLLTIMGVGLSSLMTFFWIKVAPLQLAVGIGGLCMVGGGTLGIVMLGEMICDEIGEYIEKVRQERMLLLEQEQEEEEKEGDEASK